MAAPSDPAQPSVPISYPITDLETLLSRSYFHSFHHPFNASSVPLPASSAEAPPRRRILVCHDFKGGYTDDDKWVQGGSNAGAYAVWHWYLMDIFIYFSHYLVTLPPPGWTNAAHTHGVKVLGTFIVEWEKGSEICNSLLSTTESARTYAERLAELANMLGFDGWLLNMEVSLDSHQIPNLKEFVGHLTRTMHNLVPGSLIIWYDSVTVDGELKYQNQLNEKNKPFFDICDGIFCNYSWKEDYPKDSGNVAGDRRFDVYMGIDVWGRGTYGGGQWKTNVALDVLKRDDVSAAIFGPGWLYETQQGEDFQSAQNRIQEIVDSLFGQITLELIFRWWCLVEQSWDVLKRYPILLPFYSNFDQGHGFHYSIGGFQVVGSPWNNLSCQGFQPALDFTESSQSSMQVFINFEDGPYTGGGSLTCQGGLAVGEIFSTRLFLGQVNLDQPLSLIYYVKSDGNSLMGLKLSFSSSLNSTTHALLLPDALIPMCQLASSNDIIIPSRSRRDLSTGSGWVRYESIITAITTSPRTLTEVRLLAYLSRASTTADESPYYASLGLLSIEISGQKVEFPPPDSWITDGEDISWSSSNEGTRTVSLKITWKLKKGSSQPFAAYNIYVRKMSGGLDDTVGTVELLGVVRAGLYYVSALEVPSGVTDLSFIFQVCSLNGISQELDESPRYKLAVEVFFALMSLNKNVTVVDCVVAMTTVMTTTWKRKQVLNKKWMMFLKG